MNVFFVSDMNMMLCIHYRERALFNLASPSEQDTTTTTGLGLGQENTLVDAVTSAASWCGGGGDRVQRGDSDKSEM